MFVWTLAAWLKAEKVIFMIEVINDKWQQTFHGFLQFQKEKKEVLNSEIHENDCERVSCFIDLCECKDCL